MMYKNLLSKEGSCVIMITSEAGHYYESQVGDYYSISKAGSAFLAKALCQRLSNLGIRFTELSPSTVQTKEFDEKHGFNTIKAEDIAGSVDANGYLRIAANGKKYMAHRLVWLWHYGVMPKEIDHIDGNPLNNRVENLEWTSRSGNARHYETHLAPQNSHTSQNSAINPVFLGWSERE